jgi:hypothetical protein
MGNQTNGKRFESTGPNQGTSIFGTSGFYTNASSLLYGVNVHGNECGVYGQCVRRGRSSREPDVVGIGVYGFGESFGVFGNGSRGIAGVCGLHDRGRVGVIGACRGSAGGMGVAGVSTKYVTYSVERFGTGIPDPADGTGIGVFGSSGEGPGVRGSSVDGAGGEFVSSTRSGVFGVSDSGIGVEGRSREVAGVYGTSVNGSGAEFISQKKSGVFGESDSGMGVEGRSRAGVAVRGISREERGAMFESGKNVAQMRLVPQTQRTRFPQLPKGGKVGDMILTRYRTARIGDELLADTCSLWLCVPKDSSSDDSDQWREVMLGPLVTGTV